MGVQAAQSLTGMDLDPMFTMYERSGNAWTLRVGDTIVGSGGLVVLWKGVAHAWIIPTPHIATYPKATMAAIARKLKELVRTHQLRRVQADVQTDFEVGRRFIERFGFKPEGEMPGFGVHGETYTRYALLTKDTP